MKISLIEIISCTIAVALLHSSVAAFEPQIDLAGGKGLVIDSKKRETVLKVGKALLATNTEEGIPAIAELKNPFTFKEDAPVETVAVDNGKEEIIEQVKVYSDAEVLAASAGNFTKKVRGSMGMGKKIFLQLDGGTLLKPGTSFPIRLPQAKDQTFMLTVSEITSQGYTLQVGEATLTFTYDNSQSKSSTIQFTNP